MGKPILSTLTFSGGALIEGLPQATAAGQPITFEQFNASVEGMAWKDDVNAASTANVNVSSPGASIDGVTLTTGNRVLLKNQTTASENGIYIWNGAAVAMTRAADMSTSAEFNSAIVPVKAGTANANTTWRQTAADPVVGTTNIVFTSFMATSPAASESTAGIAEVATQAETDAGTLDTHMITPLKLANWAGRPKRYSADVGDGSNTSIVLTHNLGTRDVSLTLRRNSGAYDAAEVDWGATTINTVTLVFASAPSAAQWRATITA